MLRFLLSGSDRSSTVIPPSLGFIYNRMCEEFSVGRPSLPLSFTFGVNERVQFVKVVAYSSGDLA
jgi:hypothetical protein